MKTTAIQTWSPSLFYVLTFELCQQQKYLFTSVLLNFELTINAVKLAFTRL